MAKVQFKTYTPNEIVLFPSNLGERIPKDHPVRLLSRIVDGLDLTELIRTYKSGGTTPFHPRMLLKVVFYAYMNNIYSCRKIEDYAKADFNTFYNDFIGEFATMGSVLTKFVNNQTTMVNGYDNQRLQTSGVSSDEELQKMIKYQHAYNAASRYVNVVSEMMEHLLTSLGA